MEPKKPEALVNREGPDLNSRVGVGSPCSYQDGISQTWFDMCQKEEILLQTLTVLCI